MPFVVSGGGRLEDMLDADAPARACRDIADAMGDAGVEYTRRNTPVDTSRFRDKPGRPRGAARASVHRTDVDRITTIGGLAFRVLVRTEDPAFPNIEWTTRPHWIDPRRPGGRLTWRDQKTGDRRFAKRVWHPGTKGQHPFALGALKVEAELDRIAAPALRRFARDLVRVR